ncbi:MAG: sugar-binding domain-containing protein, partial [Pseudomonadota bacterium]
DLGDDGSSLSIGLLGPEDGASLAAAGAVCDCMCHFLDAQGRNVDHPVHDRVMAVPLEVVAGARHVVLASGGARRAAAIRATVARVGVSTLVTNEAAARALLE